MTGHSYAGTGFSTETVINPLDGGPGTGSLEDFALWVNGTQVTPADRNIWGVTFLPGQSDSFYATAASNGRTWLVKGSVSSRKLTAVHDGVECPSVSPDGKRIAFKKNMAGSMTPHWNIAVLDISTGNELLLTETRNVDDQVEWLDDNTLLYGLAREGMPATATSGSSRSARIPGLHSSSNTPGLRRWFVLTPSFLLPRAGCCE